MNSTFFYLAANILKELSKRLSEGPVHQVCLQKFWLNIIVKKKKEIVTMETSISKRFHVNDRCPFIFNIFAIIFNTQYQTKILQSVLIKFINKMWYIYNEIQRTFLYKQIPCFFNIKFFSFKIKYWILKEKKNIVLIFWIKRKRENDVLYFSDFGKRFVGYLEKKSPS